MGLARRSRNHKEDRQNHGRTESWGTKTESGLAVHHRRRRMNLLFMILSRHEEAPAVFHDYRPEISSSGVRRQPISLVCRAHQPPLPGPPSTGGEGNRLAAGEQHRPTEPGIRSPKVEGRKKKSEWMEMGHRKTGGRKVHSLLIRLLDKRGETLTEKWDAGLSLLPRRRDRRPRATPQYNAARN